MGRQNQTEESASDSDATERIAIINNSPDIFQRQNSEIPTPAMKKGFWYYFTYYFSLNRDNPEYKTVELDTILVKGQTLREEARNVIEQLQREQQVSHPTFSLKTKLGLLMGSVLLLTGSGVGLYMRRTTTTEGSNAFNTDDSLTTTEKLTDYIHTDSSTTPPLMIPKRVNRHYPDEVAKTVSKSENNEEILKSAICLDDESFHFDYLSGKLIKNEGQPCLSAHKIFPEHNSPGYIDNQLPECKGNEFPQLCEGKVSDSKNKNDDISNRVIVIQGEKCLCPLPSGWTPVKGIPFLEEREKRFPPLFTEAAVSESIPLTTIKTHTTVDMNEPQSIGERVTINSYQKNDQTLQRCRDRLIGYVHSYVEVPKNVDDKELARLILTLIPDHYFYESRLSQIYLYGTGLYGEKTDEYISIKIQRQLVGDLLSRLLYGKSLDEYLIHNFSANRYISIKDFKLKILQDNSVSQNGNLTAEMDFFYKRYLIPIMPIFSLYLSQRSEVLVGSITWFLIYLSSEAEWLELIQDDEHHAIMYGIDVLNYFIRGELSQVSKIKIEIGMKFCMLYLHADMNPQQLPGFTDSWNTIRDELIKRVDLSSNVVKEIKKIISTMKKTKGQTLTPISVFADKLLVEYCKNNKPALYIKRGSYGFPINKSQFINSTEEAAWCLITDPNRDNRVVSIKIPIVKTQYDILVKSTIDYSKNANEFFIKNNFISSDYFNPLLDGDDIAFINTAALEIVSLQVTEHRFIQEKWIGPPLKKIKMKNGYIFFRASRLGEKRIYSLDKTYKNSMKRVKLDSKNLKKDIGIFFDNWSNYDDNLINVVAYKDPRANISTSEQESSSLFINKVVEWQNKIIEDLIYQKTIEAIGITDVIVNVMKDLFIPFYSCVTSLKGENATEAFVSCFLDAIFLVFPVGKKIFSIGKDITDRSIDLFFMVNKNKVFKSDGHIMWRKLINDAYIYNIILNEQTMIRISVVDLLLGSIDPGIGLMKDIKKIVINTASAIIKGEFIRLPLASIWHMRSISEFSIRANAIFDASKKISVKVSKPSGRLTMSHYTNSENGTFIFSKYSSFYQFGDYYAYYSNRNEVDILLGITEETTEDGEQIHVVLSEDEYKGVIFRVIFKQNEVGENSIVPWISAASQATNIIASDSRLTSNGYQMIFYHDRDKPIENMIFYPEHQCRLSLDGFSASKIFDIFKINDVYYVINPENKYFRPLYDGDSTEIINRDENAYFLNMIKTKDDDIIIDVDNTTKIFKDSLFAIQYAFHGDPPLTIEASKRGDNEVHFLSGKLFFYKHDRFYEAGLSTIKNQFIISGKHLGYPSSMVGWDSLKDDFIAVKPYLKKSSSHAGETLESFVDDKCKFGKMLEKFPTLLLSGAVFSNFNTQLRVLNEYHSLDMLENGNFHLICTASPSDVLLELYYDLFTESFELIFSNQKNMQLNNGDTSPYDRLINQHFSKEKYPDISDLIDLNRNDINDKLIMRLRQAAFLKRLNPIDRLDTLQLPLVQIYSWGLHYDTQSFQRIYPAAALWMTWQRQLHLLLKNKLSNELTLIDKIYLRDDIGDKLFSSNNTLTNIKYSDYEAVWIDNDGSNLSRVLGSSQRVYKNETLFSEDGLIEWLPKAKYSNAVPVTQFMYEKNVRPKIMMNTEKHIVKVINSLFEEILVHNYSEVYELEYFIISPNQRWMVSFDNQQNIMIYDLYGKGFGYTKQTKTVIYTINYFKLEKCSSEGYSLFLLSDSGILFCPKKNLWVDNNGKYFLWAPPENFFPTFISQDQRFLGFKHKDNFNTILYDQKRKQEFLLKRPSEQHDNGNITAVSFSAMNAVLALAFDDGHVYLYDLIRDLQGSTLLPMGHVKLKNIINNKVYNNILMRFEGVFDSLTIIHPEGVKNENKELDDIVFICSRYGFHGAV